MSKDINPTHVMNPGPKEVFARALDSFSELLKWMIIALIAIITIDFLYSIYRGIANPKAWMVGSVVTVLLIIIRTGQMYTIRLLRKS